MPGCACVANIKPCLLRGHPAFEEARRKGLFLEDESGEPAWVQFWDEVGAYLDFTNPDTIAWWKAKVKSALLDYGISATWNDNNEFEVWSPHVSAARLRQAAAPARETRAVQPLLMMRASRDAQREHHPGPAAVPGHALRRGRHAALRANLVGRQLHLAGRR